MSAFNSDMTAGQATSRWPHSSWTLDSVVPSVQPFFGFSLNLQFVLSILGTQVPTELLAMLSTGHHLCGGRLVGRSRGPAAVYGHALRQGI